MSSKSSSTLSGDAKVKINKGIMKKEDVQVELHKEMDYLFEKELINKQNKHIYVMDKFGASRNTHYLSPKFYAKHDQSMPQSCTTYVPFVYGSSFKNNTEANVYGWMPQKVNKIELFKELNFVNAPTLRCFLTAYGEKLENDKANVRPSFNGLRFFLQ